MYYYHNYSQYIVYLNDTNEIDSRYLGKWYLY